MSWEGIRRDAPQVAFLKDEKERGIVVGADVGLGAMLIRDEVTLFTCSTCCP